MYCILLILLNLSCIAADVSFFISDADGIAVRQSGNTWITPASLTKAILVHRAIAAGPLNKNWTTFAKKPIIKNGTITSPLHIVHQDPLLNTQHKTFCQRIKKMESRKLRAQSLIIFNR